MTDIVLYGTEFNPFVEKVRRALRLKKLDYRLVEPEGPEDYRRWNPETGTLPVADVAGERVTDSARILDALDAHWPEPPLTSPDPKAAEAQRGLEAWSGETFFFYWERYLQHEVEVTERGDAPVSRILARFGILRPIEAAPTSAERYGVEFAQRLEDLAGFLGTRPFFYSDRISRADLAVFSFVRNLGERSSRDHLSSHPTLIDWVSRVDEQTTRT